jgi:hypothetical protein
MFSRKLAHYGIHARIRVLIQHQSVIQRDNGREPAWDHTPLFKLSDLRGEMTRKVDWVRHLGTVPLGLKVVSWRRHNPMPAVDFAGSERWSCNLGSATAWPCCRDIFDAASHGPTRLRLAGVANTRQEMRVDDSHRIGLVRRLFAESPGPRAGRTGLSS